MLIGIGLGLALPVTYIFTQKHKTNRKLESADYDIQIKEHELVSLQKELSLLKQNSEESKSLELDLRDQLLKSETEVARHQTQLQELERRLKEKANEQTEVARQMHEKFENLANKIFEEKSTKLSELNQEKLKTVLQPLDKDIREFRKKVEEIHEKDAHRHIALREFVNGLQKAQTQLSEDAQNLTQALKGDSKKQGDWGEFILERALEASGLTKDFEFSMQSSFDGKRPDAIINLPGNRQLIVDAKVSLTAYERSISASTDEERKQACKEHLFSVRKHIDQLSEKDYSSIEELNCPDFTLMFIPVEPAFGAALSEDPELYQYAFDRKIALITASTLMATIKTVANLWKLEKQNKHAQDIAKRAGLLFDKFTGFLTNLEDVGKSLHKALGAHDRAIGQLSTGPGNLIGQAEKLQAMGIRTKKEIPPSFCRAMKRKLSSPIKYNKTYHDQSFASLLLLKIKLMKYFLPALFIFASYVKGNEKRSFSELASKIKPSVVTISTTNRGGSSWGVGSGFVVNQQGVIATNFHVIGDHREFQVELNDGTICQPIEILGIDRSQDLALFRVNATNLHPIPLGNSDEITLGETILSIGNPLGYGLSISKGVISAVRELEFGDGRPMIQVAIPIEAGSSGSPVVNQSGEVVAILTIKSGGSMGFGVPVNSLKNLLGEQTSTPIDQWFTVGMLDKDEWLLPMGANSRQKAGIIRASGMGTGFGGRTLCLQSSERYEFPFDLEAEVRLSNENGAAGLVFASDGLNKHYGFYPTNGSLRLTCFNGPRVFDWKILNTKSSDAYLPNKWNLLRVRFEQGGVIQCHINNQLIFEEVDFTLKEGWIGFASSGSLPLSSAISKYLPGFPAAVYPAKYARELMSSLKISNLKKVYPRMISVNLQN